MSQEVYQPKLAREGKRPWRIVGAHEQQSASGAAAPRDIANVLPKTVKSLQPHQNVPIAGTLQSDFHSLLHFERVNFIRNIITI